MAADLATRTYTVQAVADAIRYSLRDAIVVCPADDFTAAASAAIKAMEENPPPWVAKVVRAAPAKLVPEHVLEAVRAQ